MSQLLKEDTIFEKAMEKYNYFTDNEDLLNEYDKREAYLVYQHSLMRDFKEEGKLEGIKEGKLEGIREGIEQGIEKGRYAEQISMAKAMKNKNMDINLISEITGLSIEEVRNLRPDWEKL